MKHLVIITAIAFTCSLSFANSSSNLCDPDPVDPPPVPSQEVLKGFISDYEGMTLQVASNGCTDKNNFEVIIMQSHPAQVQINRLQPDNCRAYFPHGTTIRYTYQELGLDSPNSFYLVNEVNPGLLPKR